MAVVVVGSCMVDFVSYAENLPKEGETIHGTEFVTNFGGKGANQCVAATKLGAKTTLIARVGDDDFADKYIANLDSLNVCTSQVYKTKNSSTGIAQINVSTNSGANQIVIVAGANSKLNTEDIAANEDLIKSADVLLCQLETSVDVAIKACQLSKGVSILNGAPAVFKYPKELLSAPDIFCVNEYEAEVFSNQKVETLDDAKKAIKILLEYGCKSVLLTLGSKGAMFASKTEPADFHHIASPEVKSVDSTGAGDAFIGALAYILSTHKEAGILKAIEFACAVAADSVTRPGTQISFPGKEIIEKIKIL